MHMSLPSMDLNVAMIKTKTETMSNTGSNLQVNSAAVEKAHVDDVRVYGDNYLRTGDAWASSMTAVNANQQTGCDTCGRPSRYGSEIDLNMAAVKSSTFTQANSGLNEQYNQASVLKAGADDITVCGDNVLKTGDATAKSHTWTVVNTSWSGWAN